MEAGATATEAGVTPVIRDACPSVHEPFAQLDGALVRIRVPGGLLSGRQARRIAEAACAYGTVLEITSRANLQIRGVRTGSHHLLVEELVAAGVTLADAAADARRNVLASPTAGIDVSEVSDTRPLTAAIADVLARAAGAGLSPKFGVLVDGGGAVHVRGRRQDICLGAVRLAEGSWGYEVRLGQPLPELEAELEDVEPRGGGEPRGRRQPGQGRRGPHGRSPGGRRAHVRPGDPLGRRGGAEPGGGVPRHRAGHGGGPRRGPSDRPVPSPDRPATPTWGRARHW